jgi:hypothetical protein
MASLLCIPHALAVQDEVLIAGFGRRGHAVGDIPGVRFKVRMALQQQALFMVLPIPMHARLSLCFFHLLMPVMHAASEA